MAILHTINKSPFENNSLTSCLRLAKDGSSILFIEDGVYGATNGTSLSDRVSAAMDNIKIYVLGEDLAARGFGEDHLIEGVSVVDYSGFVSLVADHDTNQAWL